MLWHRADIRRTQRVRFAADGKKYERRKRQIRRSRART
jgi:hypothetical protein